MTVYKNLLKLYYDNIHAKALYDLSDLRYKTK